MTEPEAYEKAEFKPGETSKPPQRIEIRFYPAAKEEGAGEEIETPRWLEARIITFIVIAVGFSAWLSRHFDISSWWAVIATTGPAILTAVLWSLGKQIESHLEEKGRANARRFAFFILSTRCLVPLGVSLVLLSSFVSSVTVVAAGVGGSRKLTLATGDNTREATLHGPDGSIRFLALTTPFGKPASLKVDGFKAHVLDIAPLTGTSVHVGRDLTVPPTVLIRVPFDKLMHAGNGSIELKKGGKTVLPAVKTAKDRGSLLVGPNATIPTALPETWRLRVLTNSDEKTALRSMLAWETPVSPAEPVELGDSETYEALFHVAGKVEARATFTVSGGLFQDILMVKIPED